MKTFILYYIYLLVFVRFRFFFFFSNCDIHETRKQAVTPSLVPTTLGPIDRNRRRKKNGGVQL